MDMHKKRQQRKETAKVKDDEVVESKKTAINWYPGHMAKTKRLMKEKLALIDIVFELVDSRIPYSSKILDLDDIIKNKERILIFTKSDLCDMEETKKWMTYYQDQGYTVLIMDLLSNPSMNEIINATNEALTELNEKRSKKGLKPRKSRAMVVGIPNVGKSTLINRLAGKKAVSIGNKPGVTKSLDWIRVNKDVELLDTPGILWPKFEDQNIALNLASMTAIKEEVLPIDLVVTHILTMLNNYYNDILRSLYKIDEIDTENIENTLTIIGENRGLVSKGNVVDLDKVMMTIINDVKSERLKGVTFDRY